MATVSGLVHYKRLDLELGGTLRSDANVAEGKFA
jgi:hypothetical protein